MPEREPGAPRPVVNEISGVVNTHDIRVRLEHLNDAHRRTRKIAVESRELLISVCGTDGRNGKMSTLFESREQQGKRLGAIERELSDRSARLAVAEKDLIDSKSRVKELEKRTHQLGLKVAGMSTAIAAAMMLIRYLLAGTPQ